MPVDVTYTLQALLEFTLGNFQSEILQTSYCGNEDKQWKSLGLSHQVCATLQSIIHNMVDINNESERENKSQIQDINLLYLELSLIGHGYHADLFHEIFIPRLYEVYTRIKLNFDDKWTELVDHEVLLFLKLARLVKEKENKIQNRNPHNSEKRKNILHFFVLWWENYSSNATELVQNIDVDKKYIALHQYFHDTTWIMVLFFQVYFNDQQRFINTAKLCQKMKLLPELKHFSAAFLSEIPRFVPLVKSESFKVEGGKFWRDVIDIEEQSTFHCFACNLLKDDHAQSGRDTLHSQEIKLRPYETDLLDNCIGLLNKLKNNQHPTPIFREKNPQADQKVLLDDVDKLTNQMYSEISKRMCSHLKPSSYKKNPDIYHGFLVEIALSKSISKSSVLNFTCGSQMEQTQCKDTSYCEVSDKDVIVEIFRFHSANEAEDCIEYLEHDRAKDTENIYSKDELVTNHEGHLYMSAQKVFTARELKLFPDYAKLKQRSTANIIKPNIIRRKQLEDHLELLKQEKWKSLSQDTIDELLAVSSSNATETDFIPAIGCPGWPKNGKESLARISGTLGNAISSELLKFGYHFVTKTSKNGNPELDWRISFSVAEVVLINLWSDAQRLCHIIIKTGLKQHLNIPTDVIDSYVLKTVMLWESESKPAAFWSVSNIGCCVLTVMDSLIHSLSCHYLPHYFVDNYNLLQSIPLYSIELAMRKISWLRSNSHYVFPEYKHNVSLVTTENVRHGFVVHNFDNLCKTWEKDDCVNNIRQLSEYLRNAAILTIEEKRNHLILNAEYKRKEYFCNAYIYCVQVMLNNILQLRENYLLSSITVPTPFSEADLEYRERFLNKVRNDLDVASTWMMLEMDASMFKNVVTSEKKFPIEHEGPFGDYCSRVLKWKISLRRLKHTRLCDHGFSCLSWFTIQELANMNHTVFDIR